MEIEAHDNLIEDKAQDEKYSYSNFIKFSFQICAVCFLDIIPVSFSYYVLKQKQDNLVMAALGFGLTYQTFCFSFLYGFSEAFGVYASRYFGAKNYGAFTTLIFQTVAIIGVFMIVSLSLMIFSPEIMEWLQIDKELRMPVTYFLYKNIVERIFDTYNTFGRNILVSQGIVKAFLYINIICLSLFFVIAYICFTWLDMTLEGYIIARYAKTFSETILLIYFIKTSSNKNIFVLPSFHSFFGNLKKITIFYVYAAFGLYGEYLAIEASSNFAAAGGTLSEAGAWMSFINVLYYFNFLGVGMGSTLRTHLNMQKGKHNIDKMFWIAKLYYKYAYLSGIILAVILFTFARTVAYQFTLDSETLDNLTFLLRFYSCFLFIDFNLGFSGVFLRTLDRAKAQFFCTAIYFPIVMITSSSISTYKFHLGNTGIISCYATAVLSTYVLIIYLIVITKDRYKEEFFNRPSLTDLPSNLSFTSLSNAEDFL